MVFLYMAPVWMLSARRGGGIEGQDCTVGTQSRIIERMPQIILTPAQRKAHRSDAHHLNPVVLVGGDGLTDAVKKEVDAALKAHGLIKVRVLGNERLTFGGLVKRAKKTGPRSVKKSSQK